jgi:ketosteroid isomerase-like protein
VEDISQIQQAESRLRIALLASDIQTLDDLLSVNTVFTNQAEIRLTKADDIAAHQSGLLRIDRLELTEQPLIRLLGDGAIVWVTVELEGAYDAQPFGGVFAYSRVWHRQSDGRWQIEAAHCSPAEHA